MNSDNSSYEGALPKAQPQAPRSISAATADKDSAIGRNNTPLNPGSDSQMRGASGNKRAE